MRLVSLRLRNFRQHANTQIDFRPGLTGIIGPNGAGKSTILEGIAWAIYGSAAARGTNDTIRYARAQPRSRVEVELRFALGEQEFRVVRSMHQAEVYLDGGSQPVAATLAGATQYLQQRLGMTREEFFNTYFTGQKELQFLAAMGPAERGRFLSQVLGYERLRRAQDLVRERRSELRAEIRGLKSSLGDLTELVDARIDAQKRSQGALDAWKSAQEETAEAQVVLGRIKPRWDAAQVARDRHRELTHALDAADRDRAAALRDVERADAGLREVSAAEEQLAPLREQLAPLPALRSEAERWTELRQQEERRNGVARRLEEMEAEVDRCRGEIAKRESAPELETRFAEEIERNAAERTEVSAELEEKRSAWLRDRQDAETKLGSIRDLAKELQEQIRNIRKLGPKGICPTCGRPLGDGYEAMLEQLEDKFQEAKQDGIWWKSRFEQLQEKPEDVAELETREKELTATLEDRARKHARCQVAVQELDRLTRDVADRERRREDLSDELSKIPSGYDRELHQQVLAALRHLEGLEREEGRLGEIVGRRVTWEAEREEARGRETAAAARHAAVAGEIETLGFSDADFAAVKAEYDGAVEHHRQCELRETERKGAVGTAEEALQAAERAERQYHERAKEIVTQQSELDHLDELDEAYTELRTELNDQVRPELSEIASMFLAQLTDGRYTSMEIDDSYNLMVLDEGEEKPVISGGEEDIANLVLRLSLSQMIAERAGHPLSLLILDEVFGSLDVARRDNVLHLLHNLEDRFEQVILITHIEGIREGLDQVLRVEYDERNGTSRVSEESTTHTDEPTPLMAA